MSVPARIGPYEILTQIAQGGMGAIYLARTGGMAGFERYMVLKTLAIADDDHDTEAMFLDEARVLGGLHHHRIAAVHDVARADDYLFMVMEYVHGRDGFEIWQRCVELNVLLPLDFVMTVGAAAASGLHYAHTRRDRDGRPLNIVHRDVSLSNLMIGYDGAVKLIDFGIAKAANRSQKTQVGFVKGKLGYMAPEQVRTGVVDARTDVFALGIVLYELTTLRRAFRLESDQATLEKIKTASYVPPSQIIDGYPPDLERVIGKALRLDPRERYQDAEAMRRDIESLSHKLELVLGDAAVIEVMGQLFDDRTEPWQQAPDQRRPSRADSDFEFGFDNDEHNMPTRAVTNPLKHLRAATEMLPDLDQQETVVSPGASASALTPTPTPTPADNLIVHERPATPIPARFKPVSNKTDPVAVVPPPIPKPAPVVTAARADSVDQETDAAFANLVVESTGAKGEVDKTVADDAAMKAARADLARAEKERADKAAQALKPSPAAPKPDKQAEQARADAEAKAEKAKAEKAAALAAKEREKAEKAAAKAAAKAREKKVATPVLPPAPQQRRSLTKYVLGGLVGLAAIVAILSMVLEGGSAPKATPDARVVADAPRAGDAGLDISTGGGVTADAAVVRDAAVTGDAAAAKPGKIKLVITSNPTDATVELDGKRLGRTPLDTEVELDASGKPRALKVRKRGFVTRRKEITLDKDVLEDLALTPEP